MNQNSDQKSVNYRDAWHDNHGVSRTEAKRRYISTLIDTMHQFASTTPEARELVSELEFVWDQIKSNTASSSGSSPGQVGRSQAQPINIPSYASLGHSRPPGRDKDHIGSGGLRVLRPVSDRDDEGEDNEGGEEVEDYQEAHGDTYNDDGEDEDAAPGLLPGHSSDLDIRNRKWRKRIERALVTLTTEVAALREQMEAKRLSDGKRRNGIWAWMAWLVWVALRHTLINLTILGVLVVWARRKRDKRVEMGVGLVMRYLGEQMRRVLKPLRLGRLER